jgi:L-alanine-DL-glutamate epimerase-like enolase superfamily enzyme
VHGLGDRDFRIESLRARPLSVPLREPFVIATGRVDATRAVEIEIEVARGSSRAVGLGEAACLPPVTPEDQPDVLSALRSAAEGAARTPHVRHPGLGLADDWLGSLGPVARAGVETALADALAKLDGVPLRQWLGGAPGVATLETDVTVAIASPEKMAELARDWVRRGFRALKIKVGKDLDADVRALEAIDRAVPGVELRVDANAGYRASEAMALARACERLGLNVTCWEQPCAAADHDGLAEVSRAVRAPVIADESIKHLADVEDLVRRGWAGGINLKLAKTGSLTECVAMGRAARAAGLRLMMGGMVETRLGMTAAAHVAAAVGGVDFVDLDTAWLLADDPYVGGYESDGPRYTLPVRPGLGVERRSI